MWRRWELSLGAHGERAGLQAVKVGHDQQQVWRGFDRQEAAARYIDAQGVVKAFDGGTDRRLQLDDILPTVERLIGAKKRRREEENVVILFFFPDTFFSLGVYFLVMQPNQYVQ